MNKSTRYTPEDDAIIIEMRADNATEPEIAKRLGRTVNSIHCRISRLVKKGVVTSRYSRTPIDQGDIDRLVTTHQVPVDVVQYLITLQPRQTQDFLSRVEALCVAYRRQGGVCRYFGYPLTLDKSFGGMQWDIDEEGDYYLLSIAAKRMKGRLRHSTFVSSVKVIYEHLFT